VLMLSSIFERFRELRRLTVSQREREKRDREID